MVETTEAGMPYREPHWWGLILAALSGLFAWRVRGAQDAVRVEQAVREIDAVKSRVAQLEHGQASVNANLSAISAQLEGIGRTLERLERRLDGKADK